MLCRQVSIRWTAILYSKYQFVSDSSRGLRVAVPSPEATRRPHPSLIPPRWFPRLRTQIKVKCYTRISKKSYKILEKQKNIVKTLGCWNLRISIFLKTEQKKTESRMNYDFICTCRQKDCVSLLMATASSVHVRVLIAQQNKAFIQSYGAIHSHKWLIKHYSIISEILNIKMAIQRVSATDAVTCCQKNFVSNYTTSWSSMWIGVWYVETTTRGRFGARSCTNRPRSSPITWWRTEGNVEITRTRC